jgi:hypothetical protein
MYNIRRRRGSCFISVIISASSGMLRRVVLVRIDVSEELSSSIIRVTRIDELGTTLALKALFHNGAGSDWNKQLVAVQDAWSGPPVY